LTEQGLLGKEIDAVAAVDVSTEIYGLIKAEGDLTCLTNFDIVSGNRFETLRRR
jgi:hypothetical protein